MTRRQPWKKLWHEKMLSSPRFRRLSPYDRGVYFTLLLLADKDGRVVSGKRALSAADVAYELGRERSYSSIDSSIARLVADGCGLVERAEDGTLVVAGFEELAG